MGLFIWDGHADIEPSGPFDPSRPLFVADIGILVAAASGSSFIGTNTYIFTQSSPLSTWNIVHNLGKYPSVTIVDSSGKQVVGTVQYMSPNQLILTFSAAFGGVAYLN